MAIALVNSALENVNGNYTSKAITIPATSAGNTLVVVLGTWGNATATLADNKAGGSSSYTTDVTNLRANYWDGYIQVFYLPNCAAGITEITASFSTAIQSSIWVGEYSGIDTTTPLDAKAATNLGYNTVLTGPSVTTTASGDLILGAFSIDGADFVPSPLNGFSTRANQQDNSGTQAFCILEKLGSAAGSETPSMNVSYTTRAGAVTIAFKAYAGPPPASAVITEQNLPSNYHSDITVNAVGTNTSWTADTTWTPSGVAGWSVASKTCVSATSYTIVLTPPDNATPPNGATGTLTLTEGVTGSVTATTTVGTPTVSLSPASGLINGTVSLTLTGANTLWDAPPSRSMSGPIGSLFTVTGGTSASITSISVVSNTSATATLTVGSAAGTLTIADASTGATATFSAQSSTATIAEQNLPSNHNGNITVSLTGVGTAWTSSTTWTPSGVAGWSVASKTCNSATSYTVVLTPPAAASPPSGATGTLTLTEGVTGTVAATTTIGTPTLALSVSSGQVNGTQGLTLTGTNTRWSSETASTLFTVSGGTGASIGSISVASNTSATATLTKGSESGTLTITDASTGATATFTVTPAGITLVNSTLASGASALTNTITIPATAAGNLLVVAVATYGWENVSLSDNKSGGSSTYTTDDTNLWLGHYNAYEKIFYLPNCAAGITQITATHAAAQASAIWVGEYSGVATSSPLDARSKYKDTALTVAPGNMTTTQAGDLILGFFIPIDAVAATPSSGYTLRVNQTTASPKAFYVLEKIGSAAGTENPSVTWSAAPSVGSAIGVAFKAASGPPPASATITEQNLPANHNGNITVHAVGTNTNWTSSTTWTASGVSGWSVASKTYVSPTAYTIVLTPPTSATPPSGATGTLTLTEGVTGSVTATTTIGTPTLSLSASTGQTNGSQTITLTGVKTIWSSETPSTLFTVSGGNGASISAVSVASNTSATAMLTHGTSAGTLTITDASTGATASFTVTAPTPSATITEQNLPANHEGNITVHAVGTNTSWTSSTTWTASGVVGWSVASKTYVSPTSYTIVLTPPDAATPPNAATGTLTLTEGVTGTVAATTTIGTPTLTLSVSSGAANGTQSLTLTGSKTLWSSEAASTLFTVSGGTGASIGSISLSSNTSATAILTKGSAAGTLTITDASTGATATFTVTTGSSTGVIVFLGNSTTYGSGIPYNLPTYPSRVMEVLDGASSGRTGYVVYEGGATIARMQQIFFDASGGTQNSHYAAGQDNVVVILGGGSDLPTHTGAETWSYMQTFVTAAKAAGWRVVIASAAVNPGDTYEANRKAYHALVDANWYGFADAFAAWHTDPRVGLGATGANTVYYQDYNHPTSAGAVIYADYVLQALEALGVYTPTAGVDLSNYVLKSNVVSASNVVTGYDNYVGGSAGTYPTTATSQAAQLATDQAAVNAVKAKLQNDTTVLGVTGTFDLSTYVLKTNVVAASNVVTGYSNYVGGSAGTYPTTATTQAAQLATDQAAVNASKAKLVNDTTILGVTGTLDLSGYVLKTDVVSSSYVVTGNYNYPGGAAGSYPTTATSQAAQYAADQAAVTAKQNKISSDTTILGVTGTLDLNTYVLKSNVVAAAYVVTGNSNYVGGSAGTYPTTATSQAAQLATDQAAVTVGKSKLSSDTTILGVTGTLDLNTYVLKTDVVSPSYVVSGHANYPGGSAGTYPTTATSQAEQLAADQTAVDAKKHKIVNDTTILGVTGTLDLGMLPDVVAISDVVSAEYVVTGHENYLNGSMGTYPTTSDTQAAQLAADQAEVDAKKNKIVNDTTVLGVTGTLDLATAGGGGTGGTGARTVTVTVNDGTTSLESATVRLTKGALTYACTTDVSGQCVFNVDDGTWTVAITLPGYTFDGATLVVDGDKSQAYSLTRYALAPPAAPNLTTGYVLCLGIDGLPEANVTISAQMTAGPGVDGYALDTEKIAMVSGADGVAQHTGFVRGAAYKFRRGNSAWWTAAQVAPNAATWNLREILGSP